MPSDCPRIDEVVRVAAESSPREVLRRMLAMFETGDISDVHEVVASDYLDHQGLDTPLVGPDGFMRVVGTVQSVCPQLRIEVEDEVSEGDRVAARLRWTFRGEAGQLVQRRTIELLRVEHGRAAEHWGAKVQEPTA
jgi:predicted ester cyclase